MSAAFRLARMMVFAIALTLIPSMFPANPVGVSAAKAQNTASGQSLRSGVVLNRARRAGFGPAYSYRRSNVQRSVSRAGVYQAHRPRTQRRFQQNRDFINARDRSLVERRRLIERRNARVARENRLRRNQNRPINQPTFIDPYDDNGSGFRDVIDGGGVLVLRGAPCPSKHNCGYRVYSDGTGPRIITPGIPAGNGLPAFDGLNGPQVITLDD